MKLKLLTLLLAATALTAACDDDDDTTGPEGESRIRVVHASPDAPEVDVLLDEAEVLTDVPYLAVVSAYVIATVAVLITHVPGGLGVIESVVQFLLPQADLIGALLVFRFVYFLVPLGLGAVSFGLCSGPGIGNRKRRSATCVMVSLPDWQSLPACFSPRIQAMPRNCRYSPRLRQAATAA